jgi:hypothetical protein
MRAIWILSLLVLSACAAHKAVPVNCERKLRPINIIAAPVAGQHPADEKTQARAP